MHRDDDRNMISIMTGYTQSYIKTMGNPSF